MRTTWILALLAAALLAALALLWLAFVLVPGVADEGPACRAHPRDRLPPLGPRQAVLAPADLGPGGPLRNVLLVLLDDLDSKSAAALPRTRRWVHERGVAFPRHHVTSPVCCPSRASLLTGRYVHNWRAAEYQRAGDSGCNAVDSRCGCQRADVVDNGAFDDAVYARHMPGHATAYFGKYMNRPHMARFCGLGPHAGRPASAPPHWGHFAGMCDGHYYDIDYNVDGALRHIRRYSTHVIGNATLAWVRRQADRPWHAVASFRAPHSPFVPPEQYRGAAAALRTTRDATANCRAHEHAFACDRTIRLSRGYVADADADQRDRERMLRAVDESLDELLRDLDARGVLQDTYVFITSDNGFHFTEFQLGHGKNTPYDFDAVVPFWLLAPGVLGGPGAATELLTSQADLAPTMLHAAGYAPPPHMDGRSFLPALRDASAPWRDAVLVEGFTFDDERTLLQRAKRALYASLLHWLALHLPRAPQPSDARDMFRALRVDNATHRWLYVERADVEQWDFGAIRRHELYDLRRDALQINNIYKAHPASVQTVLAQQLAALFACNGATCT